jgi:hypothetical protein
LRQAEGKEHGAEGLSWQLAAGRRKKKNESNFPVGAAFSRDLAP